VGGPTTVTISATTSGAPAAKTQTFSLTVTGPTPDFAVAVVSTPTSTLVNQNVTWNGTLTALNGYNSSVHLSCSAGAPATCSITPSTVTPTPNGAGFAVTLASATTGVFSFTIQGTDGTRTHATATETLTVGTDFTWTDTGGSSVTVSAGQSANYSFSAEPRSGTFTSAVGFACSGLPQLSTCAFVPSSITAGSVTTPVTVTVSTTGPSSAGRMAGILPSGRAYFILSFGIVGIFGLGLGRWKPRLCWMILLGIGLLVTISCGAVAGGGGSGGGVTPPGTSQITVTATEAGGVSHGDIVTLVVQ
jgi:hypothetical protein